VPRARKSEPNPVSDAVRKLRECLGQTQQEFAHSLGVAITTVARWETTRPPKGKILAELERLATENHQSELVHVFDDALMADLGVFAHKIRRGVVHAETLVINDLLEQVELLHKHDRPKAKLILAYVSRDLGRLIKRVRLDIDAEGWSPLYKSRPEERIDKK